MHEQMHRPQAHPPRQPQQAARPRMPVRRPIAPAATPTNVVALDRKGDGGWCASWACGNKLAEPSSGEPLPEEPRARLEQAMGTDLSTVRIHRSADSARAAEVLGANAYTIGQDIHFGAGKYDPASVSGQRLIAHEVAHTVQQRGAAQMPMAELGVSEPGEPHEIEAERFADGFTEGRQGRVSGVVAGVVSRAVVQRDKANDGAASSSTGKPATDGSSFKGAATPTDMGATSGDKDEDAVREQMKRRLVAAQSKAGGLQGALASTSALTITPPESSRVNGLYASLRGAGSGVQAMPAVRMPSVPEPEQEPDTEHGQDSHIDASNEVQPAQEPEAGPAPGVQPANVVVLAPAAPALGAAAVLAIILALVALIAAILVLLGIIKRPPIEMYVTLLIMQILMAIQQIIDKTRPKPKAPPTAVPRGRRGTPWGESPRRRRELTPRKGPRKAPDPRQEPVPRPGPDITVDPKNPDKDDPRPDCCQIFVPISKIRVKKRGRPGVQIVTVKDTRGKHTRNAAGCDVQALREVTTHDANRYGPCLQEWILAVRAKKRDYGGQMGADSAARYEQIAQRIIEKGTELRGNKYWGDAGEPVGVDVTTGEVTNNARVDGVPNEAHIIPQVAP